MRERVDESLLRLIRVKKRDPGKTLSDVNMATSQLVYLASQIAKMSLCVSFCRFISNVYAFGLSLPYCDSLWRKHPRGKVLNSISQLVQKFPPDSTFFPKQWHCSLVPESDAILVFLFYLSPLEKRNSKC